MNHSYFLESDMSLMEAPERNLAFDLVRVTEAAALASARWLGRGDKNAGDGAAVDAMRLSFNSLPIAGKVVIGEGEKDEAPCSTTAKSSAWAMGLPLTSPWTPSRDQPARLWAPQRHCRRRGRSGRQHVQPRPQLLHEKAGCRPSRP